MHLHGPRPLRCNHNQARRGEYQIRLSMRRALLLRGCGLTTGTAFAVNHCFELAGSQLHTIRAGLG
jgi:hypothetical protein